MLTHPSAPPRLERFCRSFRAFSYGFTQIFRVMLQPVVSKWHATECHSHPGMEMRHHLFFFLVLIGFGTIHHLDEILTDDATLIRLLERQRSVWQVSDTPRSCRPRSVAAR